MNKIVFVIQGGKPVPAFLMEDGIFVLPSGKRKKGLTVFASSSLKGKFDPSNFKDLLRKAEEKVEEMKREVDDELLWESLSEPASLRELARIYFGQDVRDERLVALYLVLDSSRYFRRKGEVFIPRTGKEVGELMKMEEAERKRRERVEGFLKQVREGRAEGPEADAIFSLMKDYVIYQGQIPERRLVEEIMSGLGLRNAKGLLSFLVRMGRWEEEREPLMEKLKLERDFPGQLVIMEKKRPADDHGREHDPVPALAIDEEQTVEVDDAVSLRREGDGYLLAIHVCDLASYLPKDSGLDREARKRVQTVYLPEKKYFMLPEELVLEKYTLSAERPSRAMTLYLKLNHNMEIEKWWFSRTFVEIERLTYQEADSLLDKQFPELLEFFSKRQEARRKRGAIIMNLPELEIKVEGGQVEIFRKKLNTPSHSMVQEAMILYNEKAAEFLAKTRIPAVYRTQPFDPGEIPELDPSDPLYIMKVIPYLKASQLTTHPQPNLSLGVNYYTQATSPLRRYGDLLIQRQITHALGLGSEVYSTSDLMALFEEIEERSKQIKELIKQRRFYWIVKYLSQRKGKILLGYYSRFSGGRHMAFFPDLLLELPVSLPWNRPQRPGREFPFRVQRADPAKKTVLLVLAE